jgi:hypothetical protein
VKDKFADVIHLFEGKRFPWELAKLLVPELTQEMIESASSHASTNRLNDKKLEDILIGERGEVSIKTLAEIDVSAVITSNIEAVTKKYWWDFQIFKWYVDVKSQRSKYHELSFNQDTFNKIKYNQFDLHLLLLWRLVDGYLYPWMLVKPSGFVAYAKDPTEFGMITADLDELTTLGYAYQLNDLGLPRRP